MYGFLVEFSVEKQFGILGKYDIEKYGVEVFINKCKESVFVYEKQWCMFIEQFGYWVDMEDFYIILENLYIESVWNVFGMIYDKGFFYKGYCVLFYCLSC